MRFNNELARDSKLMLAALKIIKTFNLEMHAYEIINCNDKLCVDDEYFYIPACKLRIPCFSNELLLSCLPEYNVIDNLCNEDIEKIKIYANNLWMEKILEFITVELKANSINFVSNANIDLHCSNNCKECLYYKYQVEYNAINDEIIELSNDFSSELKFYIEPFLNTVLTKTIMEDIVKIATDIFKYTLQEDIFGNDNK